MASYICKGLLDDSVDLDLLSGTQSEVTNLVLQNGCDSCVLLKTGYEFLQGRKQSSFVHPKAEAGKEFAQARVGLFDRQS